MGPIFSILILLFIVSGVIDFTRKQLAKKKQNDNVIYMDEKEQKKTKAKITMPDLKLGKIMTVIVVILLLLWLRTSFYTVDQTEYAFVTTFGKPTGAISDSGLKFKLPFPIQSVTKLSKETYSLQLGYSENNTTQDMVVNDNESKMITGDENIILADLEVQWRIVDPIAFSYNAEDPEVILKNATSSALRNVIGSSLVDDALTDGRTKIIGDIREKLIELVDYYQMGIAIVNVNLQDVDLPTSEVDAAFKAVTDAREERITKVNEANKYKNEKLNQVKGESEAILSKAEGDKVAVIEEAKGNVASFNALYSEYKNNPQITRQRLSIETLTQVYKNARIIIVDDKGDTVKYLPVDSLISPAAPKGGN